MGITKKEGVRSDFGDGGSGLAPGVGDSIDLKTILWMLLDRIGGAVADTTALSAIGITTATAPDRVDGKIILVKSTSRLYRYNSASTAADATSQLVVTPTDAPATGRWECIDDTIDLILPVTFATADAAVLFTCPAGMKLAILSSFQEVTVSWSGGASSATGASSSNAGLSTKGDVLGGAAGDVAATLVSTGAFAKGTKGTKIGTPGAVIVAGETIRFDRITSIYTAGAGNIHVIVSRIA